MLRQRARRAAARIGGLEAHGVLDHPRIYHPETLDGVLPVATEAGYAMAERLAKEEGLCVGHSSGGNVASAIEVASRLKEGVVVTILCDHGDRYVPL